MSGGIELQLNNIVPGLLENPEQLPEQGLLLIEFPRPEGSENGAIFFNLDWQNQRAESLRQTLAAIFGETAIKANPSENQTNATLSNLINLAREHEDFKEFRRQPETLLSQVRQMLETRVIEHNGNEIRTISRFEKLVETMQAKKMSVREFVQTLPPNERTAFKFSFQLRQTFGANILNDDGTTLSDAGQTRFREISVEMNRQADLSAGKFAFPGDVSSAATRGEKMFGAKSAALLGANIAAFQNSGAATKGNTTLQNPAPANVSQAALGSAIGANLILPETVATRGAANAAMENKNQPNAAQRENGTIIGGALIGGAFARVDDYKNAVERRIGDSSAGANAFGAGGGLASGATGALFGAAVGTVIPGAGAVVSGVLGFVSSVVVGVNVDAGLRWLGAGITFNAIGDAANWEQKQIEQKQIEQKQLARGILLLPGSNLQLIPV